MFQSYSVAGTHPMSTTMPINSCYSKEAVSSVHNTTILSDSIKTDFGKIKGIEVLYFKNAELERTSMGQSKFATMGPFQVLYFPQYDRFVLSINSWKYPLLKNIPVIGSSASGGLPVTYTLPTVNGYFTIVLSRVDHLEGLLNLETILEHASKFMLADSEEISGYHKNMLGGHNTSFGNVLHQSQIPSSFPLNGNIMRGTYSPTNHHATSHIGQSFSQNFQPSMNQSSLTASGTKKKRSGFLSRILRRPEYGRDKGDRIGTSRYNLNMLHKRDIMSIKSTTEVMAAAAYYPRKEVERWFLYNKDMAGLMNFQSGLDDGFDPVSGTPRINQSISPNASHLSDPSLPCNQPITSDRPIEGITYQPGQNFTSSVRHDGKIKNAYIQGHSHTIHPDVAGRFNNMSRSEFQSDRFKTMTNTSTLYENTGISPINKLENPFSFTQEENNVILEDSKPSITERIKGAVSGHHAEPEFASQQPVVERIEEPRHVSFTEKLPETLNQNLHPTTQPTSILKSPRAETRQLESTIPSHIIHNEISQQPITSTLPTLQERIRTVAPPTTEHDSTLLSRVRNVFNKPETGTTSTTQDLGHAHYAA